MAASCGEPAMTPIECRRNAADCLRAADEENTSENLRRMFLRLAQGWIAAAERIESAMGLNPSDHEVEAEMGTPNVSHPSGRDARPLGSETGEWPVIWR